MTTFTKTSMYRCITLEFEGEVTVNGVTMQPQSVVDYLGKKIFEQLDRSNSKLKSVELRQAHTDKELATILDTGLFQPESTSSNSHIATLLFDGFLALAELTEGEVEVLTKKNKTVASKKNFLTAITKNAAKGRKLLKNGGLDDDAVKSAKKSVDCYKSLLQVIETAGIPAPEDAMECLDIWI